MSQPGEMNPELGLVAKQVPVEPQTVDVAIVMDLTGSMSQEIAAVANKMIDVFDKLREKNSDKVFKIGFVGYRDYDVRESERYVIIDFTEDIATVSEMIRTLRADGGDDVAEDVAGGLQKLIGLSWSADVKQVLYVADAPAHGRQYHSIKVSDYYPDGDVNGLVLEDQMGLIAMKQIGFTVFRMNESNDIMYEKMDAAYQRGRGEAGVVSKAAFIVADVAEQLAAAKAVYHRHAYDDSYDMGYDVDRSGPMDDEEMDRGDSVCRSLSEPTLMVSPSDSAMYEQLLSAVSSQL